MTIGSKEGVIYNVLWNIGVADFQTNMEKKFHVKVIA